MQQGRYGPCHSDLVQARTRLGPAAFQLWKQDKLKEIWRWCISQKLTDGTLLMLVVHHAAVVLQLQKKRSELQGPG
jgi:hypothetical protein